jgi:hypothetical protein
MIHINNAAASQICLLTSPFLVPWLAVGIFRYQLILNYDSELAGKADFQWMDFRNRCYLENPSIGFFNADQSIDSTDLDRDQYFRIVRRTDIYDNSINEPTDTLVRYSCHVKSE